MGKKYRLLLVVIFSSILFLGSNLAPINSYELDWIIGEPYLFGISYYDYYEERSTENDNYVIEEIREGFQIGLNITDIDLVGKTMDFNYYDPFGNEYSWTNYDYDMRIYNESVFAHTNSFFYINYCWDEETESVVLCDFNLDYWFNPLFFVEPNWADFNIALKNVFNGSVIVDIVDVPSSETDIEITFGYFLESLSKHIINNKNSMNNALDQFTTSNTELTLHFDLSNVMHESYYDSDLAKTVFIPVEEFKVDYELRYSDGGMLEYFIHRMEIAIIEEVDELYFKGIYENSIAYGGLKSLKTPLNLLSIIPALLVSVLMMKFSLKKKKGVGNQ